jgi:hypothetical protein
MPATRPFRPADRASAIEELGDARAVDQTSHRVHTANGGPAAGVAVWVEPGPGGEPYLGEIKLPSDDRQLFYQLIQACAQDAFSRGHEHASFTVHDARLLSLIQRTFTVDAIPAGWDPESSLPVQWDIRIELQDALEQLDLVLDA